MKTYSYHLICRHCHGEGTVDVEVTSYCGHVGYTIQTQRCTACTGTGVDTTRTITLIDDDPEPDPPAPVLWHGGIVNSPGFDTETFTAALHRVTARGFLHLHSGRHGEVTVNT